MTSERGYTDMQTVQHLPSQFSELEQFLPWALATEALRLERREKSTLEDIRTFYGAVLSRIEEVIEHFRQADTSAKGGKGIAEETNNLYTLMLAFADASLSIELHKSHTVPDGMAWDVWQPEHDSADWQAKPKIRLQPVTP
ncbi:hypothetical protein WDL1P1_00657 (plasmid) [Variovorax sp. WDL1]|nr:hypothetical protein APY03_1487 [Variovorax sp. WDL1]PNG50598.1 hypothetical protein CHC06_06222 [Variovorax sp. B2]PNG51467.1 hypothetical protein CHC07_06124 [Variovorax sp. B4]VTV17779.1 hypothetical protein WDL1P1_00657 [Variovorax sp. WDL1]